MKKFTQKFFLLAIGMILSVGTYAQDEVTHHWPEVRFTLCNASGNYVDLDGNTTQDAVWCTVPAWDAWLLKGNSASGHIRVQKYEKTGENTFYARLVTRYAITDDNRLKVPGINATTFWVKINDTGDPVNMVGLQYKDIFETTYNGEHNVGPDGTNYDVAIIETSYSSKITGEYKIPVKMTHKDSKETYNIDEIGAYAFRQPSRGGTSNDAGSSNYVQATKIIIPKEIKSIGRGAFFMNAHTTAFEFEEGCPVEDILEFNFQDNTALQTISFLASVKKLYGTVLGGCKALKKVTFASENPPTLIPFTWSGVERNVFETTTSAGATKPDQCIIEVPLHAAKTYVDSNDKFKEFPMSSKFKMNKAYVTFCSDLPFTFKQYDTASKAWNDGGVKAYYVVYDGVKVNEEKVVLTEITEAKKIPSSTTLTDTGYFGVVLNGTANETYDIFYPNNLISDELQATDNCMQGVVKATIMGGENPGDGTPYMAMDTQHYSYYVLTNGEFLSVTEPGTFGAHKAFLKIEGSPTIPSPQGARGLSISLPDETTGITTHEVQGAQNDAWYTLQGIQVQQPSKGIFIKNGKKFVIK